MADGTWLLQDSPIFWFTSASVPPRGGVYTSYDLGLTDFDVGALVLPEVEAAMRGGSRRFTES